jgi:hypothetical protein
VGVINKTRILELLHKEQWADFVFLWLRVSWNPHNLRIWLVPREPLLQALVQLHDDGCIEVHTGESPTRVLDSNASHGFRLTAKGARMIRQQTAQTELPVAA